MFDVYKEAEKSIGTTDRNDRCLGQRFKYKIEETFYYYTRILFILTLDLTRLLHGKGIAPSTTVQKASGAVIDDACTVFDDGSVLLFGELSSLSLTTRVPCFFRCMRNVDDREHAPRLFRFIHCA